MPTIRQAHGEGRHHGVILQQIKERRIQGRGQEKTPREETVPVALQASRKAKERLVGEGRRLAGGRDC